MATFWFIRHGQSEKQLRPDLIGGRSPMTPLTDLGERQAKALGKSLDDRFDMLWHSTLYRATQTANLITESMKWTQNYPFIIDSRLTELDQGNWEGLPRKQVYTPAMLQLIKADALNFCAPNGESQADVTKRMLSWFEDALFRAEQKREFSVKQNSEYGLEPFHVAIIGHGIAIKCLLCHLFNIPNAQAFNIVIDNCSVTKIHAYTEGEISLKSCKYQLQCLNYVHSTIPKE